VGGGAEAVGGGGRAPPSGALLLTLVLLTLCVGTAVGGGLRLLCKTIQMNTVDSFKTNVGFQKTAEQLTNTTMGMLCSWFSNCIVLLFPLFKFIED
jgi:hypothetical protein